MVGADATVYVWFRNMQITVNKSQTYTVVSAPVVSSFVFMRRSDYFWAKNCEKYLSSRWLFFHESNQLFPNMPLC